MDDHFLDPVYFVCAVLNPEFNFYWLSQMNYKPAVESHMKQSLIQMILDECEHNTNTSFDDMQHTQPSFSSSGIPVVNSYTTQSVDMSVIKKCKRFQYNYNSGALFHSAINPMNGIDAYTNDPMRSRFSLYWNNSQLYALKNVVKRIFSIQVSSTSFERVFSQAGIIMSPKRTTMRKEIFRSLVFLRVNQNLIKVIV
ncbi:unnamed protein product [Rotaria sp. Silwood2]|nr:unnamed protein product [Rotaria sp. Silwood2]CAF2898892.1 unnamed protein product [Rotaria sp. Silwood2]CAF3087427.1 unnamed protein product [Rotaria sp. Silwood2]CAF4202439.1 unnamed protein product [Rotaria sp. Silwood2]CAF4213208.1 unnamed protein product [Rotaria sp. Silwood2]